jgi:DNA-binding protein H-NS
MDITQFTTEQLEDLQKKIPAELARREKETKAKVRQELEELAQKHGFSLDQLLNVPAPEKTKKTVPPKYRHPTEASLTWTGRGRQPHWVTELLSSGITLESLTIN